MGLSHLPDSGSKLVEVSADESRPWPVPTFANFFGGARVEEDFEIVVGFIDLQAIHKVTVSTEEEAPKLLASVTHRLVIPHKGLLQLRDVIEQLLAPPQKADTESE